MPREPHIAVIGSGTVEGTPDRCTLHAALNVMADSAAGAVSGCSEVVSKALAALQDGGVGPSDVRTTNLSVQDFFEQDQQRVTARVATYRLEVIIRRLDDVGKVLADLTAAAGDSFQVRSLNLSVGDTEPLMSEARRLAVHDAQRKAAELAEAAGVELGSILSLRDVAVHRPDLMSGARRTPGAGSVASAASPPLPVEPGTVMFISSVVLVYAIA